MSAALAFARLAGAQGAVAISNGIEAVARRDVAGAMGIFRRAAADSSSAVRSVAEQWLGHLSWSVYSNPRAATEHLDRALLLSTADSSLILVERARLLGFEHRYRDGLRSAARAMRLGADEERRGIAARTLVTLAVDAAFAAISARANPTDSIDVTVMGLARDTLRARVEQFPGRTPDAMGLLDAGVLLRDRTAIATGWASYFTLLDDSLRPPLDSARRLIGARAAAEPGTPMTDDLNVGMALAMSRMYEPAALLMEPHRRRHDLADGRLADATVYGSFTHDLQRASVKFYRRALVGSVREGDLDRTLNVRTRDLWAHLRWPSRAPPFYPSGVRRELARRFSTVISVERTSAIPELHLAQLIGTVVMTPPSRPRSPQTVYVLDQASNNGVNFWLLDGSGGRAGWVSGDSIFAIRTGFTDAPFRTWTGLTKPAGIANELARIQRDSVADLARVRADSAGYLPGVAARLFRSGATAILDLVARDSMSLAQQQAAFVEILFHQLMETTIALHETRHLADAHSPHRLESSAKAEFRAKIDEVAYATRPKLAMSAILHPNIGDPSPHGQANRQIMLGLIRWIRDNAPSIAGYDASAAPLIQLPLLTNAQLRAAFLSMRATD